ncbi:MAG TPA: dephospho-CoA kinase [Isosphaeraceae bacterium]|nr:dephospho-CoA kinase [Isosphaeraceae bacterium]
MIGLTGAIGGGKSQVAALLGKKGAVVIDADRVGHDVLEHPEVRRQVIERFGAGVVEHGPDAAATLGPINRQALGSLVFAARPALDDLEAIVHPQMRQQFEAIIDRESVRGHAPAVVLDAAILLEAGWDKLCDLLVFVDASQPVRLQRVARGRGWTAEALQAREAAQWPRERKLSRADIVIHNDSSLETLDQNVDRLFGLVTDRESFDLRVSGTSASSQLSGAASGFSAAVTLQPGAPPPMT